MLVICYKYKYIHYKNKIRIKEENSYVRSTLEVALNFSP